jgi:hypothetical protein
VGLASPEAVKRARPQHGAPLDVVVVGAGPYGLAVSAHLASHGVEHRVFGEPMESWVAHMPDGMQLRSRWNASHIADPDHALGLAEFERAHGLERIEPVPVERFVDYGRWFQSTAVPHLERRRVERVSAAPAGIFEVELDDGERFPAKRVVVATGIVPFAHRPPEFSPVWSHVSHTADLPDLGVLAGKRVAVVGGGQSAVESAALLAEAGAEVELLVREAGVRWLPEGDQVNVDAQPRRFYAYSRIALSGPEGAWLVALPAAWRFIPRERRLKLSRRVIRPAAAGWLASRMEGVTIAPGLEVESAAAQGAGVRLRFRDGSANDFEHVLLATGYRIDVSRHRFLDPELVARVRTWRGHPLLDQGFESNVSGLHFMGAQAMVSFGPVMRFVCGTWASGRGVTRRIVGRKAPRAGFSW